MQIEKYNNSPNFGIRYANKSAWNSKVLKSFENSNLLREIDKKYPDAEVYYYKYNGATDLANDEEISTLSMTIKLAKEKLFNISISSHNENIPEKHFEKAIPTYTLDYLEKNAVPRLEPTTTISFISKKSNPIVNFFKKLFKD